MYTIALKMLTGDRGKYLLLISAISFSALLITHQSSVFLGLVRWSTATIRNTQAPIWVVDPLVEQVNEVQPLKDTDLHRVRSLEGVEWVQPLYFSIQQAKLESGGFKSLQLMGVDSTTFFGTPAKIVEGSVEQLRQANAVIIDKLGQERFSEGRKKLIGLGDIFEINDRQAKVVAICEAEKSFFGYPYVYTTCDRMLQYLPSKRKNLSFLLVKPKDGISEAALVKHIMSQTGLKAYTSQEFSDKTTQWIFKNTGIPISFGTTILLGFLVGIAVAGQTFYAFVLENTPHLGALKAMGATNALLRKMLLVQALFVGIVGYGIGVGLVSLFGSFALKSGKIPFYLPASVLIFSLLAILFICGFATLIGIRKVQKLDPAEVFRG